MAYLLLISTLLGILVFTRYYFQQGRYVSWGLAVITHEIFLFSIVLTGQTALLMLTGTPLSQLVSKLLVCGIGSIAFKLVEHSMDFFNPDVHFHNPALYGKAAISSVLSGVVIVAPAPEIAIAEYSLLLLPFWMVALCVFHLIAEQVLRRKEPEIEYRTILMNMSANAALAIWDGSKYAFMAFPATLYMLKYYVLHDMHRAYLLGNRYGEPE